MADPKSFWASKIAWSGIVLFLTAGLEAVRVALNESSNDDPSTAIITMILGAIVTWLRTQETVPIRGTASDPTSGKSRLPVVILAACLLSAMLGGCVLVPSFSAMQDETSMSIQSTGSLLGRSVEAQQCTYTSETIVDGQVVARESWLIGQDADRQMPDYVEMFRLGIQAGTAAAVAAAP